MDSTRRIPSTLVTIVDKKRDEIREAKLAMPLEELRKIVDKKQAAAVEDSDRCGGRFITALSPGPEAAASGERRTRIIAEIKRSSPSRGLIRSDFSPREIAAIYKDHNAAAISVLTTRFGFDGCIEYIREVGETVDIPVLRKDFIFDEYQIYESCVFGADALLLIASILDEYQLKDMFALTEASGMDALVEIHAFDELEKAVNCGAKIIGINNRNLKSFEVDINTTAGLIREIPAGIIIVSESGINCRDDIERLEGEGVDAFLIGTALMTSADIGQKLDTLMGKRR